MRKRKMLLVVLAVIGVLLLIAVIGGRIAFSRIEHNLKGLLDLPVAEIDVSKIKDGDYPGAYKAFPVEVEVLVRVRSGRIEKVDLLKHVNGRGQGAEALPARVVEKQSLKLDAVTGATYSSKVILKAIESALLKR